VSAGVSRFHLSLLADESFERHGDHPAVWFEGRWYGAAEMHDRMVRLGAGLAGLGLEPGDRVVVLMANCPDIGIAYHALWRAGATVVPTTFLLPAPEIRRIVSDAGAVGIVTTPEFLETARAATEALDHVRWIASTGDVGGGVVAVDDLARTAPGTIAERRDDDLAALLYTGGTTGRAKGVMLSHQNLWLAGRSMREAGHVPGVTRTILSLPLSHSFGLVVAVASLHGEEPSVAVLTRWFEPRPWLELIGDHAVQRAIAVPTMLQVLLGEPLEELDLSSLRFVNTGAAALPPEIASEFERRVPGVTVLEGYGLTETAASLTVNPPDRRRLGSVGVPMAGYEVRVTDDGGRPLPAGDVGEVWARGPGIMAGYWRAPGETADVLQGGWLRTGDLGRLDEDGYLWIVDRKKDLIIRSGFNVFPRDVEDALLEHPAVAFAGVVGRPDPVKGEEVVAFVALSGDGGAAPEDLVAFTRERLSAYQYPREVRILDGLPLTTIGKVDRKALRELL
jgi:long-chain acyl-CoA synthetase